MNQLLKQIGYALMFTLTSYLPIAHSAPISRDIQNSASVANARENGGYFELGAFAAARNRPLLKWESDKNSTLSLDVNLGFQWNGLFIDVNDDESVVLGFNAINTKNWSYDLVAGVYGGRSNVFITGPNADITYIQSRTASVNGGLRATGFYNNTILQFELRQAGNLDFSGYRASALIGRGWQVRNFNFHGVVGLSHSSARFNDYYLGVREDEASALFPEYVAGSSFTPNGEVGFTYPLNPNFLFKGRLNYTYMSDAAYESPITREGTRNLLSYRVALYYVF